MNYHLISSIIKGVWAIDADAAIGYAPLLNNIFGNSVVNFEFDSNSFQPYSISNTSFYNPFEGGWNTAPEGSIAVIPINGPLMKNDQFCGPVGMATIGERIKEADKSPNIDGIILKIDSPGGTVDGTETLAEIVKQTSKPVIAFADGLIASAALWIGAATNEIIAATNKTMVGSIGVLISFADMQPAFEKLGVKFHSITADQSSEKTKMFDDIREGNYESVKKEHLNPLAQDFIDHIKSCRPGVTDQHLTGKVFFAENVIGSLVDSIGNFDYAIQRMNELVQAHQKTNNTKPKNQMEQFAAINKALGVDELASTEDGVFLNEQQLETINAIIEQTGNDADALTTARGDLAKAQEDLKAATEENSKLTAELEELRNTAGAETATVITEKETATDENSKDGNVVSEDKSFFENLEAVEKEFGS